MEKLKLIPPWTGLGKKIESKVRKALFDFDQVSPKIAVALSGGKDSITLLLMLKAISGRGFIPFQLHAVHVSGEFSCGGGVTTPYLKSICDSLSIPLTVKESKKTLDDLECYSCSRERRKLLFDAAKEAGCTTIAFGHHQDDNAQTVLMNLLHKGEFCGNLPKLYMHDFQITIIRPLIYVTEQEAKEFAALQGFLRIVCRCPVGQNSMRKKTDLLIQDLEHHFPNARANLSSAALLFGSEKARNK
jgi:tRNA(Ile)-lysidine synthase TilS/MesJ